MSLKDKIQGGNIKKYSYFDYDDVKEAVLDFNFFMKYSNIREGIDEDECIKISEIMSKYSLKPKYLDECWTCKEVSRAIFGDFEK